MKKVNYFFAVIGVTAFLAGCGKETPQNPNEAPITEQDPGPVLTSFCNFTEEELGFLEMLHRVQIGWITPAGIPFFLNVWDERAQAVCGGWGSDCWRNEYIELKRDDNCVSEEELRYLLMLHQVRDGELELTDCTEPIFCECLNFCDCYSVGECSGWDSDPGKIACWRIHYRGCKG